MSAVLSYNPEREAEIRRNAWRAERIDELHAIPQLLVAAVGDRTYRQEPGALEDLLIALTSTEKTDTALDSIVLQHAAAMKAIDRLVQEVVDAEEKHLDFRDA